MYADLLLIPISVSLVRHLFKNCRNYFTGIKLGRYTDSKRAQNRAFEVGRLLSAKPSSIKTQELPLTCPFLMTPPDTPIDDDQDTLSPQTSKTPETNNAVDSLLLEANNLNEEEQSSENTIQSQSFAFQNDFIDNTEVLTLEAEPLSNIHQDENIEFPVSSSEGHVISQNGALMTNELNIITGNFRSPVSETDQSRTNSSLLDSILYESIRDQSVVQQVSVSSPGFTSSSPLSLVDLGDNDIVTVTGSTDSNASLPNLTAITTEGSFDQPDIDKRAKRELFLTPSATCPVPVLEPTDIPDNITVNGEPGWPGVPTCTMPPVVSGTTSIFLDTFIDHITNIYNHYDAHGSDFFQQIHKLFFEYLVSS